MDTAVGKSGARWALAILFLVYVVNMIDRQILSILLEPIKHSLHLTDTQLGLLSGTFGLAFAVAGIPIARLADRTSRRNIIVASLAVWSGLTALCGMAQNFWQLLVLRTGVAAGEAGGGPPAHSMLSDYFQHGRRATALAIYSCGVPIGILFGLAVGGAINQAFDWRVAFMVVGAPGILLALVMFFTVKEPARETAPPADGVHPSLGEVLKTILSIRAFRSLLAATALHVFAAYALTQWHPAFMIRTFHVGTAQVGLYLGLVVGITSGIGTFLGGWLGDLLGRRRAAWYAWLPAVEILVTVPFYFFAYSAPTFEVALLFLIIPSLLTNAFTGPIFGTIQSLAPPHMRAMAAAVLLFIIAVVGQSLGPQAVGLMSDLFKPQAGADSLRWAMSVIVLTKLAATFQFWRAGRLLEADLKAAAARA
ncbi:MFS transporter [Phenylobacterium sp.]|uniref:spinster family MFS transporter n=1 Tax=Phenylobacterium sp. TaxID=1871053 RepID=UPI0025F28DCC|nr:MFS transporter [Phenylobacterium sp.]MBX3485606.1 MFS transporter [Phenylobacterium sp.]MCW5759483.1 MFS transporter [Phenylobacterium sp.]